MILVDWEIIELGKSGVITPFYEDQVNPGSLDLRIGEDWIDMLLDVAFKGNVMLVPSGMEMKDDIPHDVYPTTAVLGTTLETLRLPDNIAAEVKLKTTPTRLGLGHPIADWVDPGFHGQLTLMLHAFKPIILMPGQRIVQLVFHRLHTPDNPYHKVGHYVNQKGPTRAWKGYE